MKGTKLLKGNNIELLKTLPENSIDSVVTDPPYGLSFMGKKWDYDVPSVEFWKEVYRVLKPGGHVLSFGGTRTYHRMVVNMEDAGFEIRDQIMWIYGSGFPKSLNIGKAVDKLEGREREFVGSRIADDITGGNLLTSKPDKMIDITKGTSEWEGWGTALKPANEPICVARKPISEKTIAENVIKWKVGGINIDGCRVGSEVVCDTNARKGFDGDENIYGGGKGFGGKSTDIHEGRFPANIIFECVCDEVIHTNPECPCYQLDQQSGVSSSQKRTNFKKDNTIWQENTGETNTMSGGFTDKGGASRFFYVAKVSKKERNMGLDTIEGKEVVRQGLAGENNNPVHKNSHPTVKPISLMNYLCRLVTPPNGIVLDPFMGSGSTGISARLEGFRFCGMEMDGDYFKIAESRIKNFEEYRKLLKK